VALGVFDERRLTLVPSVPTFNERASTVSLTSAHAIAPRRTPASIVEMLDEVIRKAIAEPSFVSLVARTQNAIRLQGI
jgi:tripartite-type tricarboxylate transporter receptor subunit TctC